MNLPDDLKRYGPSFLCDLLDGLEAVSGSLYRAWMMEHEPPAREGSTGGRSTLRLDWLGYDQDSMLVMDIGNTLEAIRTMLASYMGGRKTKPNLILPPGAPEENTPDSPRKVDGKGVNLTDYMRQVQAMFSGRGLSS